MPKSSRIPHLLQPYIHLPGDDSVSLLTSTLGASANWLITRFLHDALHTSPSDDQEGHNVLLISWMREYDFWKSETRKGAGLDLEKCRRERSFAFIDGLSGLYVNDNVVKGSSEQDTPANTELNSAEVIRSPSTILDQSNNLRQPPERLSSGREPPMPSSSTYMQAPANAPTINIDAFGHYTLKSPSIAHLKMKISSAVSFLASAPSDSTTDYQRKTLVILDDPDVLLALYSTVSSYALASLVLSLHTMPTVSHILVHIQADDPLLSLSRPPQPLEVAHHNFLVKCAHMSRRIISVRVLETGVARDVSGVVRITEQNESWVNLGMGDDGDTEDGQGKEFLYRVVGDGSVKVFERGTDGEA